MDFLYKVKIDPNFLGKTQGMLWVIPAANRLCYLLEPFRTSPTQIGAPADPQLLDFVPGKEGKRSRGAVEPHRERIDSALGGSHGGNPGLGSSCRG